ncbi:TRAP transporter small permease [Nocardioides carbamazepini]|jgi:TRAP-type C4-dicarboxylate transport system permease small subunit|uniref:TRAP transporter small permease n=1 Tax=Nocardioides TaxID=1839 RepID=UPI00214A34A0|nr:TRAP transporter small permease [Nocardioides carbamazepini]MCR1786269.1 TRAP transporter small permease [Nocardioides carbamazepini]MDQ6523409.1 TRAP transporter small permease [Nocardioides sp. LHD-245]
MSNATQRKGHFRPALLIEVPAVVVTFAMMVHVTANALMRTFANDPLPNTLEITQYWYLPIIAFLGFIAAQARGQHIAADLIYERFPEATKRYVLAVLSVLAAVVCLGFAWFGWGEAVHAKDIGKTAGVSNLVAWPPYFLVPLCFGILFVQFLYAAVRAIVKGDDQHVVTDPDDVLLLDELDEMEAQEHEKHRNEKEAAR